MSIIKLFAAVGAGVSGSVSIDVPAKGVIRTVTLGVSVFDATPVTGEGANAELSFLSTSQFNVNDARGSICQVRQAPMHVAAAITLQGGTPFCVITPVAIVVAAGERIFLHLAGEGSTAANAVGYLFIDDGIDVARAQVRRR